MIAPGQCSEKPLNSSGSLSVAERTFRAVSSSGLSTLRGARCAPEWLPVARLAMPLFETDANAACVNSSAPISPPLPPDTSSCSSPGADLNPALGLKPLPISSRPVGGWASWWIRLPARFAILLVRIYQVGFSWMTGPSCRFYPSCSHYALEALQVHGFWKGIWFSFRRIVRCNPTHPGGFDPVPPRQTPPPH